MNCCNNYVLSVTKINHTMTMTIYKYTVNFFPIFVIISAVVVILESIVAFSSKKVQKYYLIEFSQTFLVWTCKCSIMLYLTGEFRAVPASVPASAAEFVNADVPLEVAPEYK